VHWFYDESVNKDSTSISKAELVHFKSLRILSGDQIVISSGKGFGFSAEVLDPQSGQIAIQKRLAVSSSKKFHLIQAIAKGGRDEAALQSCTELGIASATALQAERSISRWDSKVAKNIERWQQIAVSAIKQSQQLTLPEIHYAASVSDVQAKGVALVLDPRARVGIASVEQSEEYSIAIGPEGGFSEGEIATLVGKGFVAVRLGDSVLRTSNAGVVALACLQLTSGQLGKDLV
jgi:16S rRNA (uracil1498-N3)-methyltransferase